MATELHSIYLAEEHRVLGQFDSALEQTRQNGAVSTEGLASLSELALQQKMITWRIWMTSLLSKAKKSLTGNQAAEYLKEARGVITTYYDCTTPDIFDAAMKMTHDPVGSQYHMAPEMIRDEASYNKVLYVLTGDSKYLEDAVILYSRAISFVPLRSSAGNLATIELARTQRELNGFIDDYYYNEMIKAYRRLMNSSAGGADRAAAVSWSFIQEASKRGDVRSLVPAIANLKEAAAEAGIDIPKRYIIPTITSKYLTRWQRLTYTGNPKDLELPAS